MTEYRIRLRKGGAVQLTTGNVLLFGYCKTNGVYQLRVDLRDEWAGMTTQVLWHIPGGKTLSTLIKDGTAQVPALVTLYPGEGCMTFEGSDGTQNVTSADVRYRVSANHSAEDSTMPEPGTSAWQELVNELIWREESARESAEKAREAADESRQSADEAAQAAERSEAAADRAEQAEHAAAGSESSAQEAAEAARKSAAEAQNHEDGAKDAADRAEAAASAAQGSAKEAGASADAASRDAQAALDAAKKTKDYMDSAEGRVAEILADYTGGYYRSYTVRLPADSWTKTSTPPTRYPYRCEIVLADCNSALIPMGCVALENTADGKGLAPVMETIDGGVRFFAEQAPEQDLTVLVTLFAKGTNSMVLAADEEVARMLEGMY